MEENIKYILGIDFGHGETTAAVYDIENREWHDAYIVENVTKRKSVMCKTKMRDGKEKWIISPTASVIKNTVTMADDRDPFSLYSNFKGPLTDGNGLETINDENREQFGKYICEIFSSIVRHNRELEPDSFVVYIACPSGWNDEQVVAYKQFVKSLETRNGRIPLADVVRESDAAYVYARNNLPRGFVQEPKVLVIDYGSSTIDFTWFGGDAPIHDGKPLGASRVEKILFDYMYKHEMCARQAFDETLNECQKLNRGDLEKIVVYALREEKEKFYNDLLNEDCAQFAQLNSIPLGNWVLQGQGKYFGFDGYNITYDRNKIREILKSEDECLVRGNRNGGGYCYDNRSYITRVKAAFEEFKNKPEVTGIDYVILTGGASCMDFVDELVSEVYSVSENNIIKDGNERSFAISRGVATWGYFHYKSSPILDEIHKVLKEDWGIAYDSENRRYKSSWTIELDRMSTLIKDKVLELYKIGFKEICDEWTSAQNTIKMNREHSLNNWLEEILGDKVYNQLDVKQKRRYDQIKYSLTQKLFDGFQSFHSLFRKIFDYIDGDLSSSLNDELNKSFSTRINEEIGELLNHYWRIYICEDRENPIQLNLDLTIELNIGHEQKKSLLWKLIEDTFDIIDSRRGSWLSSSDLTFNHNREYDDSIGVDGRRHFRDILSIVANDFADSVEPTFPNLTEQLVLCQEQIARQFTSLRYECERSLYQVENRII